MAQPFLIVGALKDEVSGLKKLLRGNRAPYPALVAHTGIGQEAARRGLDRLTSETKPRVVIGVGYAGALVEGLKTGDLIAAQEICHDGSDNDVLSDRHLLRTAERAIVGIRLGRLVTVSQACLDESQKRATGKRYRAVAVDMESFAWASCCREHGIPFLIVRSILDPVEASVPDPAAFMNSQQGVSKKRLASYVIKNPQAVWQLPQLALHAKKARDSLTAGVLALIQELENTSDRSEGAKAT